MELQITPLRDRRRQLTGYLLILRDITERYEAEVELRQANERLRHHLLEIETLQTQLEKQAMQDGLTGLFNRRYFDSSFPKELLKAAQECYPVAVILMDIDYFKKINDTFGHQAGDKLCLSLRLSRVTSICRPAASIQPIQRHRVSLWG